MQAFDCAPGPKVVAPEATVNFEQHHWLYYSGDLVQIEVDLNHGWLSPLFEPLLPSVTSSSTPHNDWHYVGRLIQRYFYGGPLQADQKCYISMWQTAYDLSTRWAVDK
jgi:hypothetical protein